MQPPSDAVQQLVPTHENTNDHTVDDVLVVGDQPPIMLLEGDEVTSVADSDSEISLGAPHEHDPRDLDDTVEDDQSVAKERGRRFRQRLNVTMGLPEQTRAAATSAYDPLFSCLTPNVRQIKVKHGNIMEDVLQVCSECEDVVEHYLQVCFVGEDGVDGGSLLKDMFSVFWIEALNTYFTGENVFVPFMSIAKQNEANRIYPLLGRILSHSTALLQTIPVSVCKSILLTVIHSPSAVNEKCLLSDFMKFITESERKILGRAVRDFQPLQDSDREEVQYIFGRFGMGAVIRQDNINTLSANLARQELCMKPLFLCTLIKSGIPKNHFQAFWEKLSNTTLNDLYKALVPTTSGVLSLIETDDNLRPEEDVTFYYLRDFIRGLGEDDLLSFLRFVTGQDILPQQPIRVMFNRLEGVSRRPIAHTCSNLLELCLCYEIIQEFLREFKAILRDPASYVMDSA
ncbi:probable E3 ubiquitin-protein ligase HERC4 [Montipora foliosa]|uniref:probable E3 ubiquitin-protein ligase HERC4 n=1 Tax=Montipora foliosa TaxID=591990 RepID=UPI0035F0FE0C